MKRFAKIRLSISRFGTARISSISAELACQIMLILAAVFTTSCSISNGERTCGLPLNYNIFCFYYNWYGNEGFDNKLVHWAHPVLPESAGLIDSGYIFGENNNIASNFFPFLGLYSNNDPQIIRKHMEMVSKARIGVLAITWWGEADTFGAKNIPLLLDEAAKRGIKVCFHIEPFPGRTVQTIRNAIQHIIDTYGSHPAFYKKEGRPLFFIYDSYLIPVREWASLLSPEGSLTIRNTAYDATMIGLWVNKGEEAYFTESCFDGVYTYFASAGFTYGSTPENWAYLQKWAENNGKIFIPSVGPGYIDTRIRPWNVTTIRDRREGEYYDRMFQQAIESGAAYLSITSFNEWHEGTQIEPAIPMECTEFKYLDYGNLENDCYLRKTAFWIQCFENKR